MRFGFLAVSFEKFSVSVIKILSVDQKNALSFSIIVCLKIQIKSDIFTSNINRLNKMSFVTTVIKENFIIILNIPVYSQICDVNYVNVCLL